MSELLFIYSERSTFYAKDENGLSLILSEYCSDNSGLLGMQFIRFLENEQQTTPYSLLSGYDNAEEMRNKFKEWIEFLLCEGLSFKILDGNDMGSPTPIKLLELSDLLKSSYNVKHFAFHKKDGSFKIHLGYIISNLFDALSIELIKLIESRKLFKKCEHCKKLFFPKDRAEKYCDRITEKGKTCKDVGYLNKVESNEFLKAYNTAYKTRHAEKQRKIRGKSTSTIEKYNNALMEWKENARIQLKKAQEGKISKDEFKKFLDRNLEVN